MSWSVRLVGTPERLCAALEAEAAKQSGQSKLEFEAALPALKALVAQNFNNRPEGKPVVLRLVASGHGFAKENHGPNGTAVEQVDRCCQVSLEAIGELLT